MAKKTKDTKKAAKVSAIAGTIELGDRARDRVTKFTGIVEAMTHWLNGCVRIQLMGEGEKPNKDNAFVFDSQQVELLAKDPLKLRPGATAAKPGGPRDHEAMTFR